MENIFNVIINKNIKNKNYFKSEQKKKNVLLKKIIMLHTKELSFNILMSMQATLTKFLLFYVKKLKDLINT